VCVCVCRHRCIDHIPNLQANNKMNFNVYVVFYSLFSHHHGSAGVSAIFRVMLLLEQYRSTDVVSCVAITP
jgi:hypothetical protein